MKKISSREKKRMVAILNDLERTLKKGVKLSEKTGFTSHNRILLHLLGHVQTMQEGLTSEGRSS